MEFSNNTYLERKGDKKYDEDYSYDANGNILTLKRHDDKAELADDFNYSYYANSNKLEKHKTTGNTYEYDAIGNLVKDYNEKMEIAWTPSGKVRSVTKSDGTHINFRYDAIGNRIAKIVSTEAKTDTTIYVRDAGGNVMSIYNNRAVSEVPIYGSSRIGEYMGKEREGYQTFNLRKYQLSNHVGNVLAVISDKVNLYSSGRIVNNKLVCDSARATVVSASDYYPFGLPMPGRQFNEKNYRYGFNTQEKVDEISNSHYTAEYWEYDPRVSRRWNLDPKYNASESRYSVNGDNPIYYVDPNGEFKTKFGAFLYKIIHGGGISREIKSGQYFVEKPVKYSGAEFGVAYQRRFGWSGQNSPIDFGGKNPFTPWDVGMEWLSGTGNRNQHFKAGDPFTEQYKQHDFVNKVKNNAIQQLSVSNGQNTSAGGDNYSLSGWEGIPKYIKDYSTLATMGATGNLAFTYLGSHRLNYIITSVDIENRTAEIHFRAHNSSTIQSALRPPKIGYKKWWINSIGNSLNKQFNSGPMSETKQTIEWSETIKW